jgi:hypothetical protein
MRFAGWFGIIVGLLMFAQWGFFLVTGLVPELQIEPYRIFFHLVAEFATAAGLVTAGIALLKEWIWAAPVYLVAAGMLLYSVIASPGYFAQQGQWALVFIFAGLFTLVLVSITRIIPSLIEQDQ